MMFETMRQTGLYPPLYITRPFSEREAVTVHLFNEARPSAWEEVSAYLDRQGSIGNTEVRQVMQTENILAASKQIKKWIERGQLIVVNPHAAKRLRRYAKPVRATETDLFGKP